MKFFQRNRSDREEALLDAMLKSPLADQVVQELEDATLTARRMPEDHPISGSWCAQALSPAAAPGTGPRAPAGW